MKKIIQFIAMFIIFTGLILALSFIYNNESSKTITDDVNYNRQSVIISNISEGEAQDIASRYNATYRMSSGDYFAEIIFNNEIDEQTYNLILNTYSNNAIPNYYVELNGIYEDLYKKPTYEQSHSEIENQTYLNYINYANISSSMPHNPIIAIIDTGIDIDHKDIKRINRNSYNAVTNTKVIYGDYSAVDDTDGHGTAIAGIINASHNDIGVVGINPRANLMIIKVDNNGVIELSSILFGLEYAINNNADIINMSFGLKIKEGEEDPFKELIALAQSKGILCVASAGNDGTMEENYPAANDYVISVGAFDTNSLQLAEYSNFGDTIDIVAPGETYTTLDNNEYGVVTGTSFSTAIVTAALSLRSWDEYSVDEIKQVLYSSAYDLGTVGQDYYYGAGLVDLYSVGFDHIHTITFDSLSSVVEDIVIHYVSGHSIKTIPNIEVVYQFLDGWYYDSQLSLEVDFFHETFENDIVVYAKWISDSYSSVDEKLFSYNRVSDNAIEITAYNGRRKYISIPDHIDGFKVIGIAKNAFKDNLFIAKVLFPQTLEYIGESAFEGCLSLIELDFPDKLKTINKNAFKDACNISKVKFSLKSELQYIGECAFKNNNGIKSIYIPKDTYYIANNFLYGSIAIENVEVDKENNYFSDVNGVLYNKSHTILHYFPTARTGEYSILDSTSLVDSYSFAYSKINDINLNNSVRIGDYAFYCSNIENLYIPDSVESVGDYAFSDTVNLEAVSIGNGLSEISVGMFNKSGVKKCIIGSNVKIIQTSAFSLSNLEEISFDLNSKLEMIFGKKGPKTFGAFERTMLKSITLPDNVKYIGINVFYGCKRLTDFYTPKNLQTLEQDAFSLTSVTSFHVNEKLLSIDNSIFTNSKVEKFIVNEKNSIYTAVDGVLYSFSKDKIIAYPVAKKESEYKILDNTAIIGSYAFGYNSYLTCIIFPSTIQKIENYAFKDSTAFDNKVFRIPDNKIIEIEAAAFSGTGFKEVYLSNLDSIPSMMFEGCSLLEKVVIGNNVSNIEKSAFESCVSIKELSFDETSKLKIINEFAFYNCTSLQQIDFESMSSLEYIGESAFSNCTLLQQIDFESMSSLEYIGESAFSNCTSLQQIDFESMSSLEYIGESAFSNCTSLQQIDFGSISSLEYIGESAFLNNQISTINLPSSVIFLGKRAFFGAKKVVFNQNSLLTAIDDLSGVEEIYFGEGSALNTISSYAFFNNHTLRKIDLANTIVDTIGSYAFYNCDNLEEVLLPDSLKVISFFAFAENEELDELYLGRNIEEIYNYAFAGSDITLFFENDILPTLCGEYWSVGVAAYYNNIADKIIVDDYEIIITNNQMAGIYKYKGIDSFVDLNNLVIDEFQVTMICSKAFADTSITELVLSPSIIEIHSNAFENSLIKKINILNTIRSIGSYAFCNSLLTEITFEEGSNLQTIDSYTFGYCDNLRNISLPNSVKSINAYAFYDSGLEELDLTTNTNITKINEFTFAYSELEKFILPENILEIDDYAFYMSSLEEVSFNSKLVKISEYAFYFTKLSNVYIPKSVEIIENYAFGGILTLESFEVSKENVYYKSEEGALYTSNGLDLIAYPASRTGEFILPDKVENIRNGAFEGSNLDSVYLNNNDKLIIINNRAFFRSMIKKIVIPKSVVYIDYYSFAYCEKLEIVEFEDGSNLTSIHEGAFYDCNNLASINLPVSLCEIGKYAFYGCASIESICIEEMCNIIEYDDFSFAHSGVKDIIIDYGVEYIGSYAFRSIDVESIYISDVNADKLEIGFGAFYDNDLLRDITLPFIGSIYEDKNDSYLGYIFGAARYEDNALYVPKTLKSVTILSEIETIGIGAFYNLSELETINVSNTVKNINSEAFTNVNAVILLPNELYFDSPVITSGYFSRGAIIDHLIIKSEVLGFSEYAFGGMKGLKAITIPKTITNIRYNVFSNCDVFNAIYYDGSLEDWCAMTLGGRLFNTEQFYLTDSNGYYLVREIIMPENIMSINSYQFSGWKSLEKVILHDSIKTIGNYAFANCDALKEINCPNSIVDIGEYAFSGCSSLPTIELSNSIVEIKAGVFEGCSSLNVINIPEYVKKIDSFAFSNCSSLKEIYIPNGVDTIGSCAFSQCSSLNKINIPLELTELSNSLFYGCESLKTVDIHENIKMIGSFTFSHSGIVKLYIPETVEEIDAYAFAYCSGIETFTLLSSITQLPNFLFYNSNIENLYLRNYNSMDVNTYRNASISNLYFLGTTDELVSLLPDELSFPLVIGNIFIDNDKVTELVIPESIKRITNIYSVLFPDVENIVIPSSVEYIEIGAFTGLDKIKSITSPVFDFKHYFNEKLSNTLEELVLIDKYNDPVLRDWDFDNYTALKSLKIQGNIEVVNSFSDCISLKDIELSDNVKVINSFRGCTSLETIDLKNVTTIGDGAFVGCTSLSSIVIPDSVTGIGSWLFGYCSSLKEVKIPSHFDTISPSMFEGCTNLTSIVFPESLRMIESFAFANTNIENIVIPKGVLYIGSGAFSKCNNLKEFRFEQDSECNLIEEGILSESSNLLYVDVILPENQTIDFYFSTYNEKLSFEFLQTLKLVRGTINGNVSFNIDKLIISNGADIDSNFKFNLKIHNVYFEKTFDDFYSSYHYIFRSLLEVENIYVENINISKAEVLPFDITFPIIYDYTFALFPSIEDLILPNSIYQENALYGCDHIKTITYPDNSIDINILECINLEVIYNFNSSNNTIDYGDIYLSKLHTIYINTVNSLLIRNSSSLKNVVVGKDVTELNLIINDCPMLENIIFENNCILSQYILSLASTDKPFDSLKQITIPDSVEYFRFHIEAGCKLKSVNTMTDLDKLAEKDYVIFDNNNSKLDLYCKGEIVTEYKLSEGQSFTQFIKTFYSINTVELPSTFTDIRNLSEFKNLLKVINNSDVIIDFNISNTLVEIVNKYGESIFRNDSGIIINDYVFEYTNNKYYMINYVGTSDVIKLPNNCNGENYIVKLINNELVKQIIIEGGPIELATDCFSKLIHLEKLEIINTDGIEIKNAILSDCSNLEYVMLDITNSSIYGDPFEKCNNLMAINIESLDKWLTNYHYASTWNYQLNISGEKAEELIISNNHSSINRGIFSGFNSIKKITLNEGIKEISIDAFKNCKSLVNVTLPSSIIKIEAWSFEGCDKLFSINIPESVEFIGYGAFTNCTSLGTITIPSKTIEMNDVFNGAKINSLEFASGVKLNKNSLGKFTVENLIIHNDIYGFIECFEYTSITNMYVDDVTELLLSNFNTHLSEHINLYVNNEKITSVTVLDDGGVLDLFKYSYYNIDTIYILNDNYTDVTGSLSSTIKNLYLSTSFLNKWGTFGWQMNIHIIGDSLDISKYGCERLYLPSTIKEIYGNRNASVKELYLTDSNLLTILQSDIDFWRLKNVYLNEEKITDLIIPEGISEIKSNILTCIDSILSIGLPRSLKYVVSDAFNGLDSIQTVKYNGTFEEWLAIEFESTTSTPTYYAQEFVCQTSDLSKVVIPGSIKKIGYGFVGLKMIEELIIPDSVEEIAVDSLRYCSGLKSLMSPTYIYAPNLEKLTLTNCEYINYVPETIKEIILPDNLKKIGPDAFSFCNNLTSINIPKSVEEIGDRAFYNCKSLKDVYLSGSITKMGDHLFEQCDNLENVYLPRDFHLFDTTMFINHNSVNIFYEGTTDDWLNVTVDNCENIILKNFYFNGEKVSNFIIPHGVETINAYQLSIFSNIEAVYLPATINKVLIGGLAFSGEALYYEGSVEDWREIDFDDPIKRNYKVYFNNECIKRIIINDVDIIKPYTFYNISFDQVVIKGNMPSISENAFLNSSIKHLINLTDQQLTSGSTDYGGIAKNVTYLVNKDMPLQYQGKNEAFEYNGAIIEKIEDEYFVKAIYSEDDNYVLPKDINGCQYRVELIFPHCFDMIYMQKDSLVTLFSDNLFCSTIDYSGGSLIGDFDADLIINQNLSKDYNLYYTAFKEVRFDAEFSLTEIYGLSVNCERIVFPQSLVSIVNCNINSSQSIIIDNNISKIINSFNKCSNISEVLIMNNIDEINNSFNYCPSLTSVTINSDSYSLFSSFNNDESLTNYHGLGVKKSSLNNFSNTPFFEKNVYCGCLVIENSVVGIDIEAPYVVIEEDYIFTERYFLNRVFPYAKRVEYFNKIDININEMFPSVEIIIVNDVAINQTMALDELVCLKSLVLKDVDYLLNEIGVYGVQIFIDKEKSQTASWYTKWNKNNAPVFYKDEWIDLQFYDENGVYIASEIQNKANVIKLPHYEPLDTEFIDYEFVGWDVTGDGLADRIPTVSDRNMIANAVLKSNVKEYAVNYYFGERIVSTEYYNYGDTFILKDDISLKGYDFIKWNTDITEFQIISDIDIYGEWQHRFGGHDSRYEEVLPTCYEEGYIIQTCIHCEEQLDIQYISKIDHNYKSVIVDSTCDAAGYTLHYCTNCDFSLQSNFVDCLGHNYTNYEVVEEATCNKDGVKQRQCTVCGDFDILPIASKGHNIKTTIIKEATCTSIGTYLYECMTCDYSEISTISSAQHKYEPFTYSLDYLDFFSSSNVEFINYHTYLVAFKCVNCNELNMKKENNANLQLHSGCAHDNVRDILLFDSTCVLEGLVGYQCIKCQTIINVKFQEKIEHNYSVEHIQAPLCLELGYVFKVCEMCDSIVIVDTIDALGHDIHVIDANKATCTEKGNEQYEKCSRCNYTTYKEIPPLGHMYGDWNIIIEATEESEGLKHQYCIVCNHIVSEIIPVLDHVHVYISNTILPTCLNQGYTLHTCKCGDLFKDNYTTKLGHDIVLCEEKAPTCTEDGHNAYQYCTRCDYTSYRVIQALGHKYIPVITNSTCTEQGYTTYTCQCGNSFIDNYTDALGHDLVYYNALEATCDKKGYKAYEKCKACDYTTYEEIQAYGHNFKLIIIEATCNTMGYSLYKCHCGESYTENYVDALGHNYIVTEFYAPTCLVDGYQYLQCTRCLHEDYEGLPAVGHKYESSETPPTCTTQGYTTYTCHCGSHYVDNYVPFSEHILSDWIIDKNPTEIEEGHRHKECSVCQKILIEEQLDKLPKSESGCQGESLIKVFTIINLLMIWSYIVKKKRE